MHVSQVVLLSARNALLSRLTLAPTPPSEDAARRFTAVAFGTSACRRGAPKISAADTDAAATAMLEDSGILDLESKVLGFLFSHAGAVKLMAGLDDVVQLLQVRNFRPLLPHLQYAEPSRFPLQCQHYLHRVVHVRMVKFGQNLPILYPVKR